MALFRTIPGLLLLYGSSALAVEQVAALGPNQEVSVVAPPGWVLDNKSGEINGVHAAVYPQGGSWADSPAVMYANCSDKNPKDTATLDAFIKNDINVFKKHDPDIIIKKLSDEFHAGKISTAMYFDNKINMEAVVYVDEDKAVCMLVLSSKSEKDYTASLPAFKTFLGSYNFLTRKAELPKDNSPPEVPSVTKPDPTKPESQPDPKGTVE